MHRIDSHPYNPDPTPKYLAFQPRVHSRQHNKSKSNKKNHINKNIIAPCEPLGDKLLKAALEKNSRRQKQNNNNGRRERTEESMVEASTSGENSRCYNHPEKRGEYFIEAQVNKRFCLKCSLALNGGNNLTFVTSQKHKKKQTLDMFKQQLSQIKQQIQTSTSHLHTSISQSQQKFSQHSAYITQSFTLIKQQLQEKRRQLMNQLIIAQQSLKGVYEENLKKMKKMAKSIDKYEFDISKFYDEIIEELPKDEFDHIMMEYEQKMEKNFRAKLRGILVQEGVCVYVPSLEMRAVVEKASVEFYQPISDRDQMKEHNNASFYGNNNRTSNEAKKNGSNSLDSKIHDFVYRDHHDNRAPVSGFVIPERKRQVNLNMFERKTGNFISPRKDDHQRHRLIEDKENINLQNFAYDYYHPKPDNVGKFTFKV